MDWLRRRTRGRSRLRQWLGTCQMGPGLFGCWHRPVAVWNLDGFRVPLCRAHLAEMDGLLGRREPL